MTTTAKGWTRSEAEDRIRTRKMAHPRSEARERVEFDTVWGEWVVINEYPGAPAVMERKRRRGLRESWRAV